MRCVAALLLTAVQGGWQAAEIQHVPKVLRSNLTIFALGDSLTAAGFGSVAYGMLLSEMLGLQVDIAGVWGERTRQMLERFQQHISGGSGAAPEVVLVLAGTNDVCNEVPLPTILKNLEDIHHVAGAQLSLVGVLGLPPFLDEASARAQPSEAQCVECGTEGAGFPSFFVDLDLVPTSYLYDHLHFTTEGYHFIAKQVAEGLLDAAEMLSPEHLRCNWGRSGTRLAALRIFSARWWPSGSKPSGFSQWFRKG
eukprot:s186_g20.t1